MPWRLLVVTTVMGVVSGAVLGALLGLDYLPTFPVAVVEGAVLVGVPSALLGLLLTGVWSLGTVLRRRLT
jgi:hypothetical protein